jgi:putative DNA primase/helicase
MGAGMTGDVVADFTAHLAGQGIHPIDPIIPDSKKLLRARLAGDKKKPGNFSYKLSTDAPASAYYNAWSLGISGTWTRKVERKLSADELARQRREAEENRRRRDAEMIRERATAAKKAERVQKAAKPATQDHPYLILKQTKPNGLLVAKHQWHQIRRCRSIY